MRLEAVLFEYIVYTKIYVLCIGIDQTYDMRYSICY